MRRWLPECALVVVLAAVPAARAEFDGCGTLVQGIPCVLFQADAGGLYVLDHYGSFGVGERVHVHGTLEPGCITICMQGNGCILNNTIGPCDVTRGDLNCDGVINAFDIDPFVLALTDPAGYQAQFPNCNILNADIDCNGTVNAFDIDPFVVCLLGGCPPCP